MLKFNALDYNILPGDDVTRQVVKLIADLKYSDDEKIVIFPKGTYYISSDKCNKHTLRITNTVGDNEYKTGENKHNIPVAFYLDHIKNLTICGDDATFVINGRCTNFALEDCENITIKGLEITHAHPHMHELKVYRKTMFTVDFKADEATKLISENNKIYFSGYDYEIPVDDRAKGSWWNAYIKDKTPNKVVRYRHPFATAFKLKLVSKNTIRAYYLSTRDFDFNDRYYIYDVRRDNVGIFVNRCKDFALVNVKQRFSYSLALVCQDTQNILVDGVEFAPKDSKEFKMSSVADFIQICMCRGKAVVQNSYFDGAGDDLLNVHGVHFEIAKREGNKITLEFKHPQTHGYNPLRVGDTIAFIDKNSLLEKDRCEILKSELINDNQIEITVDVVGKFDVGDVVEDLDACPDLLFKNNKSTRIITRGLLITTRGKVVVEDNEFLSTSMSGILLSDDAKSWYESGMCKDVTIKNNKFYHCGETPVLIKPENSVHKGAVHQNISIISNEFLDYKKECIFAKSTDNIVIENNKFLNSNYLKLADSSGIIDKNNEILA